ncbi:MAG: AbrB/MazE/SpoVT family DNA-binding domain-containing protein [Candidatus Aminicenantes bacterium]|nr:AbrB/MazE/SpoVT family DNA-binding domain-containing protein [Candidatus Aminicenantes bacterium]
MKAAPEIFEKKDQSQAVRLPKEFRFKDDYVIIKKSGNAVILIPAKNSWHSLIWSLDKFTDDFMAERRTAVRSSRYADRDACAEPGYRPDHQQYA